MLLRKSLSLFSVIFLLASCTHQSASNSQNTAPTTAESLSSTAVFFDTDSSYLDSKSRKTITKKVLTWAETNRKSKILIEGHCDERGSVEYNYALGQRRAKAVKTFLMDNGVRSSRIKIKSYGESRPVQLGHSERHWKKNRRGVILSLDN